MANPETIQPADTSPETAPGGVTTNHESGAPRGRFFDSSEPAGHLSLVHSIEAAEIVGPSRPLKAEATRLTPWGLGLTDNREGRLPQIYYGDEDLKIIKPGVVTLLEILAKADGQPVDFSDLLQEKSFGLPGDRPPDRNKSVQGVVKDLLELFRSLDLPYLEEISDKDTLVHAFILHKTLPSQE